MKRIFLFLITAVMLIANLYGEKVEIQGVTAEVTPAKNKGFGTLEKQITIQYQNQPITLLAGEKIGWDVKKGYLIIGYLAKDTTLTIGKTDYTFRENTPIKFMAARGTSYAKKESQNFLCSGKLKNDITVQFKGMDFKCRADDRIGWYDIHFLDNGEVSKIVLGEEKEIVLGKGPGARSFTVPDGAEVQFCYDKDGYIFNFKVPFKAKKMAKMKLFGSEISVSSAYTYRLGGYTDRVNLPKGATIRAAGQDIPVKEIRFNSKGAMEYAILNKSCRLNINGKNVQASYGAKLYFSNDGTGISLKKGR